MIKLGDELIKKLRSFPWVDYPIYYAVLFGSTVKKGMGNDLDIAVEFQRLTLEDYSRLLMDLEDYLNTNIDLVAIDDETSCYLVHEVFNDGLILYLRDDDAWWRMHRRARVCEDFLMDAHKLDIVNTAIKRVMERWQP